MKKERNIIIMPQWIRFYHAVGSCDSLAKVIRKIKVVNCHGYRIARELERLKLIKTSKTGRVRYVKFTAKGKKLYDQTCLLVAFVEKDYVPKRKKTDSLEN